MPDSFDRLLERTMRAGARAAEPCPSAELLAAYVDGSLPAPERLALAQHAADCQVCAEHLALLSSLEPISSADVGTPKAAWWRTWTWLVPVAASVVVAAVWVSLPRKAQVPTVDVGHVASSGRAAPEAPKPAAPQDLAASTPPASVADTTTSAAPSIVGGVTSRAKTPAVQAKAAPVSSVQPAPAEVGARQDQPTQVTAQAPASAPADSDVLKPQSADLKDKADEEQRQRNKAIAAREGVATPAPPPAPAAAPAGALSAARRAQGGSAGLLSKSEAKTTAGAAVSESALEADLASKWWRIQGKGIERSSDGGTTWQDAHAPALPGAAFISALSADVCWVAAPSGGVIRRAPDGKWTRSRVPITGVIAALAATSATDAIVTSADQRRFETKDGGATWVSQLH